MFADSVSRFSASSFFFSSRRRHTSLRGDWSSDVCSSDLLRRAADGNCLEKFQPRVVDQQFVFAEQRDVHTAVVVADRVGEITDGHLAFDFAARGVEY